ncbi:MAG TPA: hypothetical protein VL242_32985 [Sorangium sp.]|nr:hypothetical protein [Sorangium sp.]
MAEVHTRTVTPAPATVTYQEFAVVEEPVVHIAAAPVHIETYPRVVYRGTHVYDVDGRWYYPAHHGWVYSREEPRRVGKTSRIAARGSVAQQTERVGPRAS